MLSSLKLKTVIFSLWSKLLWFTAGGLMMLGLLTLAYWWGKLSGSGQFFSLTSVHPQIDPRPLIIEKIRGASELTTAVYTLETVVPVSQDRQLGGWVLAQTKLLYIATGEVKAGVRLGDLTVDRVQVIGDKISLELPPIEILDSKIDVNRSRVYDYDRGFLNLGPDVAPQLQTLAERETLKKMVRTACTGGLLEQARGRSILAVTQLLTMAGYGSVTVTTSPPNLTSCQGES